MHALARPNELVVHFNSFRMNGFLASVDFSNAFETEAAAERDEQGYLFVTVAPNAYRQAAPSPPQFKVYPPNLLKFKSFDGLEVPCMYYHPNDGKTAVPVVINIHGGPEGQSTAVTRMSVPSFLPYAFDSRLTHTAYGLISPIHGYLLNEVGCAVIYPNVRGSAGYGRRYAALDDVFKREDSVKFGVHYLSICCCRSFLLRDIGSLLDHIDKNMKNELMSSRVAVMGGSYGGYMVYVRFIFVV